MPPGQACVQAVVFVLVGVPVALAAESTDYQVSSVGDNTGGPPSYAVLTCIFVVFSTVTAATPSSWGSDAERERGRSSAGLLAAHSDGEFQCHPAVRDRDHAARL